MNIKTALVITLAAAMGLAVFAPAPASLAASAPPVPVLNWGPCHGGFQCATARVPLDYRHPDGAKISIAVIRHLGRLRRALRQECRARAAPRQHG
jgi:hypothetical protein